MEKYNSAKRNSLCKRDRLTCDYADIYFEDSNRTFEKSQEKTPIKTFSKDKDIKEEWVSPSDLLIGILELNPPFTTKITRGKTQEGILAIGNGVLEIEHAKFLKSLSDLMHENNASWNHVLKYQMREVEKKVKVIFQNIFKEKSRVMKKEMVYFYENTLQELENHLRSEIQEIVESVQANIISNLKIEIQSKLQREKKILKNILKRRYLSEVTKIKKYYDLLLHNEIYRNNILVNKAIHERNDALKAFYRQIESKRITSTMYIMCLERKKCRMKQLIVENLQINEMNETLQKLKDKEEVLEAFKQKDERITDINTQWEENIQKILHLFLKFLSFSLKMLPEQTTFLLDFEKMVVLQLNEIKKNPRNPSPVLIDEENQENIFKFEHMEPESELCENEPFVLIGDLSDPVSERFGSRETLASEVDLPYFRVQRQYVYAKCHGYENIKKFLEKQKCTCELPKKEPSDIPIVSMFKTITPQSSVSLVKSESSNETMIFNEPLRLQECPVKICEDVIKRNTFPYLASYLDFTEENFTRVTTILGEKSNLDPLPELVSGKEIAKKELPFSETKERCHTAETQYSSQEELNACEAPKCDRYACSCTEDGHANPVGSNLKEISSKQTLNEIITKRNRSLERLIRDNPNLLKILTDECFDYKL